MDAIFKKLNFKNQAQIHVLNAPESFFANLENMKALTELVENLDDGIPIEFILAFVTKQTEVEEVVPKMAKQLVGDAVVWFAYPKKSSKKYPSEITRDQGWEMIGKYGLEGVRIVAIDQDWSALRFRKVEHIKTMIRNPKMALTKEGKERTTAKK